MARLPFRKTLDGSLPKVRAERQRQMREGTGMQITQTMQGDVLALTLRETRLDATGALSFKEQMRSAVANHDGRVVLDMHEVQFMDSSGLGALVAGMKMLGEGRRLELARCDAIVLKVLALTRMDRVFVMHDGLPWESDDQDAA
ncbi:MULTISPECIES: STAS domain-containing protein [Jannaschia]|uniref:STAS domain-containing protein n=1 Tax=Jannaschia TaxID=188905 RepID=UPI0027E55734|nr:MULTISPECIES: STAS domain-containing protein [unclassified Jannaschia]